MARKPRDHKAEYARRKANAQAAGYKSLREYKAVRKALGTPRNASPVPRRIVSRIAPESLTFGTPFNQRMRDMRAECQRWSDIHSQRVRSRYDPTWTDAQVERYWRAYIEDLRAAGFSRRGAAKEKWLRIKEFLVPDFMTEKEWEQEYGKH